MLEKYTAAFYVNMKNNLLLRMKKNIILLFLFICAISANAQRFAGDITLYPHLGINFAKFSDGYSYAKYQNQIEDKTKPVFKFGYDIGIELHRQFDERFGASIGLLFAREGGKLSDYSEETERIKNVVRDFNTNLYYLHLPLLATADIVKWRNSGISIKVGVQPGILVSARNSNETEVYNKKDNIWILDKEKSGRANGNVKSAYKDLNLSIPVGVEYRYKNYSFDLRYNIGLTKVYEYVDDNINNRSILLTIGYGITL